MKLHINDWLIGNWPPPKKLSVNQSAILAFILSPVVLTIFFWVMYLAKVDAIKHRGLYLFESATLGDFLLLPISWALMSVYYHRADHAAGNFTLASRYVSLAIGLAMAVMITIKGMTSPYRDWTLPEPGKINIPGIYHSLFLAFMIWSFFTFLFDYWNLVLRKEPLADKDHSTLYWAILNLLTLFMFLLWRDALYFDPTIDFFHIDIIQQGFLLCLVLFSVVGTILKKQKPFGNLVSWILIQITWWLFLFAGIARLIP